jgi:hypothetical protein
MTNMQVIRQCYDYFRRGDGPSLLALFDAQIEFRLAEGHPYQMDGEPWVGPQEVALQPPPILLVRSPEPARLHHRIEQPFIVISCVVAQ